MRAAQVARVAEEVNSSVDNIGARRLHTVLERILEEISFEAPERVGRCSPLPGAMLAEGHACCVCSRHAQHGSLSSWCACSTFARGAHALHDHFASS